MAETAVFEQDFSLPVGAAPTPIPGSYEFIYLRSASADVIQVSANGQTWSDLPVGLMFPLTGLRKGGDIGPREPLIRAKGGLRRADFPACRFHFPVSMESAEQITA